jgi:hypothetical protein
MRTASKILVIALFIPLFLIGLLLSNIKFQALNTDFWLNTFEENRVYENLANSLKVSSDIKIDEGGGSSKDAEVLTGLITPENIKEIASNNLVNLLDFMNGKSERLDVYVPIGKLPKDLVPTNIGSKPDTIPIKQLLRSLNIQNISDSQIAGVSSTGLWVSILFFTDAALLLICLFLLFVLTQKGKRFWGMGTALLLSGITSLLVFLFGGAIRKSMFTDWQNSTEFSQLVLSSFAPFVLENFLTIWLIAGLTAVIIGMMLFFLKRPVYNVGK